MTPNIIFNTVFIILAYAFFAWLALGLTLAAVMAVVQERKIWKPRTLPSLSYWGMLKVGIFNLVWCSFCFIGSIYVVAKYCLTLGMGCNVEEEAHCNVERFVAWCCMRFFIGRVTIRGLDNLPPANIQPAPTYVANHASQIDVAAVYFMKRRIKWIAKESVIYLPGVGQIMYLSDHLFIKRSGKNKKSVSNLFEKSDKAIQDGIPVFFFPQGTRWMADRLPFKDGAFIVAKNNAPSLIVPLSFDIPRDAWNSAYPFTFSESKIPVVNMTIHPAVEVTDKTDKETLKEKCMEVIYQDVPTILKAESPAQQAKK